MKHKRKLTMKSKIAKEEWDMKFKKVFIAIVVVLMVLAGIFFAGRYGWKLLGFKACEGAGIESIMVSEQQVEIQGYRPGLNPAGFIGYHAEEKDGKLYVGFNFSGVFGFFETGDFKIQIPVESEIQEVYMKTSKNEHLIWSKSSVNE